MAHHVFLTTERLFLRRFTDDDAPLLHALDSDPEVMRFISGGQPTPLARIEEKVLPAWSRYYETHEHVGYWAAHERASERFVGWFHLRPDREVAAEMELGYRLARRFWGRGYASEGTQALIRKAFNVWGMGRVVARTLVGNAASRRVLEKCGLRFEHRFTFAQELLPGTSVAERAGVKYGLDQQTFAELTPAPQEWIEVPGGWFAMGGGPRSNENPRHRVFVSPFRLARAPVLRADYQAFLDATGRSAPDFWENPAFAHPRAPAVGPSWEDAMAYCAWLTAERGEPVTLPTEAQWECAAKAGREVTYPWGDTPPEALPDYGRRWRDGPEPVDAYASPHPWGFFGLGENVHEWCADWYDADYYEASPTHDPHGPATGRRRASRGGAWRHEVKVSRCAARSSIPPQMRYNDYGFRLAAAGG